jgi:hypothetical protein
LDVRPAKGERYRIVFEDGQVENVLVTFSGVKLKKVDA